MQTHQVLPEPRACHNCKSNLIQHVDDSFRYGGEGHGETLWVCRNCNASTYCHPGTKNPLGYMANKYTRQLRGSAHKAFDKLWKKGMISRAHAYMSLSRHMKLNREATHIGYFNAEQCEEVIRWAKQMLKDLKKDRQRGNVQYKAGKKVTLKRKMTW